MALSPFGLGGRNAFYGIPDHGMSDPLRNLMAVLEDTPAVPDHGIADPLGNLMAVLEDTPAVPDHGMSDPLRNLMAVLEDTPAVPDHGIADPLGNLMAVLEDTPAGSFARDAHAVARTNVDWKETASEHVFKADLPGLRKEDVQVQVEDGRTLTISGQRKKEEVQQTDKWHRVERSSGQFMRKFRLPEDANLDAVTAKVDSGVLTVVVPKGREEGTGPAQH